MIVGGLFFLGVGSLMVLATWREVRRDGRRRMTTVELYDTRSPRL